MSSIIDFGLNFSKKKWYLILRDILILFIIYSVCGWIYEELLFLIEDHIIVNRGAFFGPWIPIYGFGGIAIISIFYKYKDKKVMIGKVNIRPFILFLESVVLATIVELTCTYLMDITGGNFRELWDYSNEFLNFDGRIALIPDLKFGFVALFGIYILQPFLIKIINTKNQELLNSFTILFSLLFFVDAVARIWLGSNFVG